LDRTFVVKGLHGEVDRADEEIAAANHPQLRMFVHDAPYSIYELTLPPPQPQRDRPGKWVVCSPATAAQFSAIGYFFGRDIQQELHRPVGLVVSSVGGTPIEAWTSLAAQNAEPGLKPVLDDWQARVKDYDPSREQSAFEAAKMAWLKRRAEARKQGLSEPKAPSAFKNLGVMAPAGLFNGMMAPLAPYTVRGVLWYQGERNAAGPLTGYYGLQLRTLIADWRKHWHDPDLYFAYVQLPGFNKEQRLPSEPMGWGVAVRDGQRTALAAPHTAMAVTIDLKSEEGHPTNKVDYARRLSMLALHDVYGKKEFAARGPLFRSARLEGSMMVVTFDHADGLKAASGELTGFAIAGDNQEFHWAKAVIANGAVIVSSEDVPNPIAVRYGWAARPKCNLTNAAGLPASPFRTDDWK
jgi:sialate O-acetylesterase